MVKVKDFKRCEYELYEFHDGMAKIVNKDGKCGYINRKGKIVIPCIYLDGSNFAASSAKVKISKNEWGFINKENYLLVKYKGEFPKDIIALSDNSALRPVRLESGKYAYVNNKGEYTMGLNFIKAGRFSEGLAAVEDNQGEKYYINEDGNVALEIPSVYGSMIETDNELLIIEDEDEKELLKHKKKILRRLEKKEKNKKIRVDYLFELRQFRSFYKSYSEEMQEGLNKEENKIKTKGRKH